MNHIYKTIFNKRTGQITVVSEKTSNNCQSQQDKYVKSHTSKEKLLTVTLPQFLKNQLTLTISLLLSGILNQASHAETYTGDDSTLKNSVQVSTQFEKLLNQPNIKGIFEKPTLDENGNHTFTIDYLDQSSTVPNFIVLGYDNIIKTNEFTENQNINSNNNNLILKKGSINGNIYVGLSHYNQVNNNINCPLNENDGKFCVFTNNTAVNIQEAITDNTLNSNNNNLNIEENQKTNAYNDINTGGSIINIKYNDLNGSLFDRSNTYPSILGYSYAFNKLTSYANKLTSSNNIININGNHSFNNINLGYTNIELNYKDLNAQNSNVTNIPVETINGKVESHAFTYMNPNFQRNVLTSSNNTMNINGSHSFNKINVGQANIKVKIGNLNSANSFAETTNPNADLSVVSHAEINSSIDFNEQISSNNIVNISGSHSFNDINVGQANLYSEYGNLNAASASASAEFYNNAKVSAEAYVETSLNSNKQASSKNIININGNNDFKNIKIGQAHIKLEYKDINAGLTIINNIKTADKAHLNLDLSSFDFLDTETWVKVPAPQTLSANDNTVNLRGSSTIQGDITTGDLSLHVKHGVLTEWEIENNETIRRVTVDNPLLYLNGISPKKDEYNFIIVENYIDLNGTKAFANNNTISIEGEHTFVQADIQDSAFPDDPTKTIKGDYGSIYGGYLNYNKDQDYFLADVDGNATDVKAFVRPESYDVFTGNTLNYNNNVPITIKEIGNFQNYNFTLNPTLTKQNLITANTVYLGSSLENMSANQLQKNIYNTVSQEALASASVSDDIKALIPTIADDPTDPNYVINPSYVITEEVKTALLASDISQQAKNLLVDNAHIASNIHVVGIQSGPAIATGTKFVLMQANKGNLKGDGQGYLDQVSQVQQGISLLYDVQTVVDHDNDQVYALFKTGIDPAENIPTPSIDPEVNPHLKALLEGNLSGLMLLTRGADHLSDNLFGDEQHKRGLVPFAIFSGQHSRYNTGSHIKSNSGLFTAGFSVYDDNTVWGAFIENGWDSYKTYNDFDNAPDVHGKGHNRFNGVGVFGRYTFDNQVYLDGTLRGGRLHTAFETDDIRHIVTNERASYNISGNYYGASLKGGYDWAWNTQNTVDLSAKYSWASTSSHDVNITGDEFHFNGLNSHRVLLNAENSYQFTPELSLISGLGYEYEFDGKAQGTTYGRFEIDDASVKGSTGVVTAGLHYEPNKYKRLSIDLKGSGYFGKREGGSALLKVDYKF